jgi:carbon monoxide dehydrogenase subunit G
MNIDGTQQLHAPRERIFAALIDPEILRRCIPGCESLEKVGDNLFAATMKAGIGSIKGTFKGEVRLEDVRAPEHYRIVVNGKGVVGFAKGAANFDLEDSGEGTLIKYSGEMQLGGTIAAVGQRMIVGAARMMATKFFTTLEAETNSS